MQNVAQELSETIGEFRSRNDDGGLSALAVVVAVFLVSATAAAVFNHEGNAGAKVAEAAGRFDRQVDDTQHAFTDIRELIPEQKNLAAVSPESYANESTSGNNSEFNLRIAQRFGRRADAEKRRHKLRQKDTTFTEGTQRNDWRVAQPKG